MSLLFLSYTNRFLHLAALVRTLHSTWLAEQDKSLLIQINNLKVRLNLIRWMQLLGAISLLLCVASMFAILIKKPETANACFGLAVLLMAGSLVSLIYEIVISGGALRILLREIEDDLDSSQ